MWRRNPPPARTVPMRQGFYATVDGVEHRGLAFGGRVLLFLPGTVPRPPGWEAQGRDTWSTVVDASAVSRAYVVTTYAKLDDVNVIVDVVDPAAQTAVVRALNPEYSCMNHLPAPPPHPLLEAMPVSPYSVDWVGTVPWDALTNVEEHVSPVDPTTGK